MTLSYGTSLFRVPENGFEFCTRQLFGLAFKRQNLTGRKRKSWKRLKLSPNIFHLSEGVE
ncbi:hypothetical protein CDL12_26933 [Handroanthus impetiginosus]|uniref:Uncharacterized protein n=1 Tax=Handroanthus impetiginosus TaxID=429701 RepID=A0A2G9G5H6_9LAMI|nr:hypothetical protein CDL12_26933 [Handroanthus impetiginosus]